MGSDKLKSMKWRPVLKLKLSAQRFERRMKVKMIIKRIMKALLIRKLIYSFDLIYNHGLVFGITSLSMFLLRRLKYLLLAGLAKSVVLRKVPFFSSAYMFYFFYLYGAIKF